jgi:DNA invertase Pin-like site-specific DNA recombinase
MPPPSAASRAATRAFLYARYSSDRQSEHSIEDQLRICRQHAERQGWLVVGTFQDAAISGSHTDRPGFQALQAAMRRGEVDVALAEGLDRFSRDQEHVAAFHKLATFTNARIITLSEGEVGPLHIGVKGTMNALYLQDLGAKTRRGIEGRVRAGHSFGPPPYGYRRIAGQLGADGELVRGLREIVPEEAAIVQRIYREFAAGHTPAAIARRLNAERVPSPSGRAWNTMSLRGRPTRGDGILHNQTYVGAIVWNRRRRVVDPETGQTLRRLNATDERVIGAAPELRIIDADLWETVARRLKETAAPLDPVTGRARFWGVRAPEYLLSGKVVCGVCSGGFGMVSGGYYRCMAAQRHACTNRASIRREVLEEKVVAVLADKLMDPALAEAFVETFTEEWGRLAAEQAGRGEQTRRDLATAERRVANLLDAIAEGLRSPGLQAKLAGLEAERDRLAGEVAALKPSPIRLIPNLGTAYRRVLANLRERLSGEQGDRAAMTLARQLIAKVVIQHWH